MKKVYKMMDLDCANCAAKMEEAIGKLPGVKRASVSFVTQKLILEGEDEHFEEIVKQAVQICKKVEPDCKILIG